MSFLCVAAILALLILGGTSMAKKASSKSSNSGGSTSFSALERKITSIAQKVPIATLTDRNFSTYIIDRPREYHAFVMFTATAPQYQCSICVRSKQTFVEVSKYYHDQYNFGSPLSSPSERIAFFVLEVDSARSIFNDMKMETVPRIYLLPPTTADSPKMKLSNYEISSSVLMDGTGEVIKEVEKATKIKIEVQLDPLPVLIVLSILAMVVALFVSAAQRDLVSTLLIYQNPSIWVIVSAICFGVGVSGSIYCIIRSSPPFGMARGSGMVLFSPSGRDQFLFEGIIVALWTLGCGVASYLILIAPKIRYPIIRHVVIIVAMAMWIVLGTQIWDAYRAKTMWYNLKDTLPVDVWAWMSASVKKNTSIIKRLYRISEIWMTEDKGWDSFVKKFRMLIIDYLLRTLGPSKK